jgi:hypothetical protein
MCSNHLISYVVALANVLVVCAYGKRLAGCAKFKNKSLKHQKRFFSPYWAGSLFGLALT